MAKKIDVNEFTKRLLLNIHNHFDRAEWNEDKTVLTIDTTYYNDIFELRLLKKGRSRL